MNGSPDAQLPFEVQAAAAYVSHSYHYTVTAGTIMRGSETRIMAGAELTGLQTSLLGVDAAFLVRLGGERTTVADIQGEYDGGFGLCIGGLAIDYAYTYQVVMNNLGGISTISLRYTF